MKKKTFRIPVARPTLLGRERDFLLQAVENGQASGGPFLARFEREFAEWIAGRSVQKYEAVACSSGTAALHLALLALGVGPGDEVIVPALTFIAVPNAVRYCGATPILVDVDSESWTMLPSQVEQAITIRTKAIITVSLYGVPVSKAIGLIAAAHNIPVVDDAAEALGSTGHLGFKAGTLGDIGCFSFYANKTITTGEGGMVVTARPDLAEKIRLYRGQGQTPGMTYRHEVIGYNYRMTELQAGLGIAQLEFVENYLAARRRVRGWYETILPAGRMQKANPGTAPTFWMNAIHTPGRDPFRLAGLLEDRGIESRPIFPPIGQQAPYREHRLYQNANFIASHGLVLPTHGYLTEAEVTEICEVCYEW